MDCQIKLDDWWYLDDDCWINNDCGGNNSTSSDYIVPPLPSGDNVIEYFSLDVPDWRECDAS